MKRTTGKRTHMFYISRLIERTRNPLRPLNSHESGKKSARWLPDRIRMFADMSLLRHGLFSRCTFNYPVVEVVRAESHLCYPVGAHRFHMLLQINPTLGNPWETSMSAGDRF